MRLVRFRSTVKSAGVLLFSQILLSIAGPIVNLLVVRYLGPQDFGYYASALAVTSFIGILADFGTNQATLKHGSLGDSELGSAFRTGLKVSVTLALVAYAVTVAWFYALDYDATVASLGLLFALRYFATAFIAPSAAVLQTKGAYKDLAVLSVVTSAASWASTLLLLFLGADLRLLAGVPVGVYGLASYCGFCGAVRRCLGGGSWVGGLSLAGYVYDAFIFGLGGTFYKIYHQSDGALLSAMRPSLEVGFYQLSFGVIGSLYVVPGIVFNQVLYPRYFRLSQVDREHYRLLYVLTSKIMLVLGCSLCLGVWAAGGPAVALVFGYEYAPSIGFLLILALAVPFHYWASAIGSVLTTDNLANVKVRVQGLVAVVNLALNLIFIPKYGALCASVTTVACEALLALGYLRVAQRLSMPINVWKDLKVHYFAVVLTAGAVCRFVDLGACVARGCPAFLAALVAALLAYALSPLYITEREKGELLVTHKGS